MSDCLLLTINLEVPKRVAVSCKHGVSTKEQMAAKAITLKPGEVVKEL